jgi:toxin HigB-1
MAIQSFADKQTREFFFGGACPAQWKSFAKAALRKLDIVDAAVALSDLVSPPGNRLETLRGDRKGQCSIRINGQWRVCFRWTADGPADVEIADYH